jgi:hypothetical protein
MYFEKHQNRILSKILKTQTRETLLWKKNANDIDQTREKKCEIPNYDKEEVKHCTYVCVV